MHQFKNWIHPWFPMFSHSPHSFFGGILWSDDGKRSSKTLLSIQTRTQSMLHTDVHTDSVPPSVHVSAGFVNLFSPESMLEVSRWMEGGVGADGLAATVPPRICLPTKHVFHLLKLHFGYGDGWWPFLLEASFEVKRHQKVFANQQSSAEAWYTAQVLQVAPQEDGALALLATVSVHWQHMDVHCWGVWDMLSHCLLE